MPDDIVNPIGGGNKPQPLPQLQVTFVVADMISAYGGDKSLKRYFDGSDIGQVTKVDGDYITVDFLKPIDLAKTEYVFHYKQIKKLQQKEFRTLWLKRTDLEKVKTNEGRIFQTSISYQKQPEPEWIQASQKTTEWEEV